MLSLTCEMVQLYVTVDRFHFKVLLNKMYIRVLSALFYPTIAHTVVCYVLNSLWKLVFSV